MDAVLPQAPTGRPRIAAVGTVLSLCLLGAPMMSLFPVGVWDVARALTMSGAGLGVLLLAPVVVGVILMMSWLATRWLEGSGVNHPTAAAALVTATAMVTPVVVSLLAPEFTPFPGGLTANIAVLTGVITTLGLGSCMLMTGLPEPWQPGLLPGVAVVTGLLLVLPVASDEVRSRAADERARAQILSFDSKIAVLDHPSWEPDQVHEVNDGLRVTYRDGNGSRVDVLSWGDSRALDPNGEGVHTGCDFPDVRCREQGGWVVVRRGDGPDELRGHLDDGAVVSLTAHRGTTDELVEVAPWLRPEAPGERGALVETVTE